MILKRLLFMLLQKFSASASLLRVLKILAWTVNPSFYSVLQFIQTIKVMLLRIFFIATTMFY